MGRDVDPAVDAVVGPAVRRECDGSPSPAPRRPRGSSYQTVETAHRAWRVRVGAMRRRDMQVSPDIAGELRCEFHGGSGLDRVVGADEDPPVHVSSAPIFGEHHQESVGRRRSRDSRRHISANGQSLQWRRHGSDVPAVRSLEQPPGRDRRAAVLPRQVAGRSTWISGARIAWLMRVARALGIPIVATAEDIASDGPLVALSCSKNCWRDRPFTTRWSSDSPGSVLFADEGRREGCRRCASTAVPPPW